LIPQNSPEWYEMRLGVFTASSYHKLFSSASTKTFKDVINKVVAQRLTGEDDEPELKSFWTERGHLLEPEAIREYQDLNFVEVKEGGFFKINDWMGSSPDGLVGDDGLVEVKSFAAKNCVEIMIGGKIPLEITRQINYQLYTTGRKWCDFILYHPLLPLFVKRIERDEKTMAEIKIKMDAVIAEAESRIVAIRNLRVL